MRGIVVPEICWAYKKYNKIISGIYLVFILHLFGYLFVEQIRTSCSSHVRDQASRSLTTTHRQHYSLYNFVPKCCQHFFRTASLLKTRTTGSHETSVSTNHRCVTSHNSKDPKPCFTATRNKQPNYCWVSYVYWTVHHLDSWIKTDQLHVTCFIISLFNDQHVSDVNTSILRSLRLICWVISWVVLIWFDVCWCYVVVWLGWCGIRMQASVCMGTSGLIYLDLLMSEWKDCEKESRIFVL